MNYTLEHLKIVHHAGAQKLSFNKTLELIALLERNNLLHLISGSHPSAKRKGRRKSKMQKPTQAKNKAGKRRGKLSEKLMTFLNTRGAAGAHVKEIAKTLKVPMGSVSIWFYTTGKKYLKSGEIKKVAPATFAYFKPEKTG
jgi:hypothetical protein